MNKEFEVHMLNDDGKAKAREIATAFDDLLDALTKLREDARGALPPKPRDFDPSNEAGGGVLFREEGDGRQKLRGDVMDPKTGQIYLDVTDEEARKRALVEIPKADAERVINMNRKQRRAWAAKQRKAARAGHKANP